MLGLWIYLAIGVIVSGISMVKIWQVTTKLRKDTHERYLQRIQEIKDYENQHNLFLWYYPLVFDVNPWYMDYLPIIIGCIFSVALYPIDLIRLLIRIIRRKSPYTVIKYDIAGMHVGYEE